MGRNLEPKCKQCRRIGEKLMLKGERCLTTKCAMVKRNYPPGFHGPKGRKRSTDFGLQLNEKQKAKKIYQLTEQQFRLSFVKAQKKADNTAENFIKALEMRLDNTIYRIGFASSRTQARQLISHGHIQVNQKKVTIPSYELRIGESLAVKAKSQNSSPLKNLKETLKRKEIPGWLNLNMEDLSGKVVSQPKPDELKSNFNIQMIIEFYSR
jgi:small subunit ribosomal protein S4